MAIKVGAQLDLTQAPVLGLVFEPGSSAPADPVDGQPWHDTLNERFMIHLAGDWHEVAVADLLAPVAFSGSYNDLADRPNQNVLLLDRGASVPAGTPVGTLIFEKAT